MKSLKDRISNDLIPQELYIHIESLVLSFFTGEYSIHGWPRFKGMHGYHSTSPYSISKYWVKIPDSQTFSKELRIWANWIESELKQGKHVDLDSVSSIYSSDPYLTGEGFRDEHGIMR